MLLPVFDDWDAARWVTEHIDRKFAAAGLEDAPRRRTRMDLLLLGDTVAGRSAQPGTRTHWLLNPNLSVAFLG